MCSCDIMDKFHNNNGFTYACTAEQTDFTAHCIRSDKVNDFNACFQNFSACCLLVKSRSRTVDRPVVCCFYFRVIMVNSFTENVEDTAQYAGANRYADRSAGIYCFHAANKTIGRAHGNSTDNVIADMLHNFTSKVNFYFTVISSTINFDSIQDRGHCFRTELNVNNRANNLYYSTSIQGFSLLIY